VQGILPEKTGPGLQRQKSPKSKKYQYFLCRVNLPQARNVETGGADVFRDDESPTAVGNLQETISLPAR
jgi:hypothetical protein